MNSKLLTLVLIFSMVAPLGQVRLTQAALPANPKPARLAEASAVYPYSIIDLGTLELATYPNAINETRQVAGVSVVKPAAYNLEHAFFWENGTMADLGTLPNKDRAWATDINDVGFIVGY